MKFVTDDSWTGPDKIKHLAFGVAIAFAGGLMFDPMIGLAAGAGIGVAKEVYDGVSGKGTASLQDMIVTVVGAAAGAAASHFLPILQALA